MTDRSVCKGCKERYGIITEKLDKIISQSTQARENFAQNTCKKVKLDNLKIKEKFHEKAMKPFLKLLQGKRNSTSSLSDSSAEYNLSLW